MAIKTWPYGGKPSIAVAKETKSSLLTVRSIKLWGAVTPVTPRETKRESEEKVNLCKKQPQTTSGSVRSHFSEVDVKVLVIPHRWGCNYAALRGKKNHFYQ